MVLLASSNRAGILVNFDTLGIRLHNDNDLCFQIDNIVILFKSGNLRTLQQI